MIIRLVTSRSSSIFFDQWAYVILEAMAVHQMSEQICSFDIVSFKVLVEVVHVLSYEAVVTEDCEDGWVVVESGADLLIERGK